LHCCRRGEEEEEKQQKDCVIDVCPSVGEMKARGDLDSRGMEGWKQEEGKEREYGEREREARQGSGISRDESFVCLFY
jgi:hypothetical protein